MYFIWADILSPHYFVALNYKPFSTLNIPLSWLIYVYRSIWKLSKYIYIYQTFFLWTPTSLIRGSLFKFSENSPTFGDSPNCWSLSSATFFFSSSLQQLLAFFLFFWVNANVLLCLIFLRSRVLWLNTSKAKCLWL